MRDEFYLDPRLVRRSFDRASGTYDAAAGVQGEIRARLLERLDIVRLQPTTVLDLGAGTGHASRALKRRYPAARVIAMDLSPAMLQHSSRQQSLLRRFSRVCADAHRLPMKSSSVNLVLSNLMLQWCHDPDAVFAEVSRVLEPQGLFTFTAVGPDTLKELRDAWRSVDVHTHVHRFIDMHDFGDALMRAGFAEPVMDTERLTVTYPSLTALTSELRASGSRNVAAGRRPGLLGRGTIERLGARADSMRRNGQISISVEVIYGQAWAAQQRVAKRAGGEISVPLASLRRRRNV